MLDNINDNSKKLIDELTQSLRGFNSTLVTSKESMSDFERKIEDTSRKIKDLKQEEEKVSGEIEKTDKKIKSKIRKLKDLEDAYKAGAIGYKKYLKVTRKVKAEVDELRKETSNLSKEQEKLENKTEKQEKRSLSLQKTLRREAETKKVAAKASKSLFDGDGDYAEKEEKAVKRLIELRRQDIALRLKAKQIKPETAKKLNKQAESYARDLLDPGGAITKKAQLFSGMGSSNKEEASKARYDFSNMATEGASNLKNNIKGLFKGNTTQSANSLKDQFSSFKTASKGMVQAGKAATVLGGAVKLLTAAFGALAKAHIIGLIIGAVAGVVNLVNKLDKFIKAANQSYFALAGPITSLKGLTGSMREFTDTMYNAEIKMKYGINAEEVVGAFKGMSSSGMSLKGVKKYLGSYDTAIESAVSLSKSFGVGLDDMGSMVADQMLTLRSSIDEVSDAFSKMSFDAASAGLASNKFYQEILNATASLSFYGNYLKETSGLLSNFIEEGSMGAKDAASHVTTLMQTLANMSLEDRLKLTAKLDAEQISDVLDQRVKRIGDELEEAERKLSQAERSGDDDEINASRRRVSTLRSDYAAAQVEQKSTDPIDRTRGFLAEMMHNPNELIFMLMDQQQEKVTGTGDMDAMSTYHSLKEVFPNLRFFEEFWRMGQVAGHRIGGQDRGENLFKMSERFEGGIAKESLSRLEGIMSSNISREEKIQQAERELQVLKNAGEAGAADELSRLLKEDFRYLMAFVEERSEGSFTSAASMIEKLARNTMNMQGDERSVTEAEQKDIADEVADQTTEISKYLGIGKESLTYALATSDVQTAIAAAAAQTAQNTGGILNYTRDMFRKSRAGQIKDLEESGDAAKLLKYSQWLTAGKSEQARIQAIPENERTSLERRYLAHADERIENWQSLINEIKDNSDYKDIQSHLSDIERQGFSVDVSSVEGIVYSWARSGEMTQGRRGIMGHEGFTGVPVTHESQSSRRGYRSGITNETIENDLSILLDTSKEDHNRTAALMRLTEGIDNISAGWLIDNPTKLNNLLTQLYGGTGNKTYQEALASQDINIILKTPKGTYAELANMSAEQATTAAATNSEQEN
jgi:hypothetical protein